MIATMEQIKEMDNQTKLTETKFTISAETLKGIKEVFKGHKNASIPVLNGILIEMVNDTLINVKYSNADLFVSKMLFANVENIKTKGFVLPIEFFKGIKYIKKNEEFVFEVIDNNQILFTRNNLTQKVTVIDQEEYISFDFLEKEEFESVETSNGYEYFEFSDLQALQKAIKSVSKSESRPALQEIEIRDGYVVSTDSHRLFRSKTSFKSEKGFMINPELVQKAYDICNEKMFLKMSVNDNRVKIEDDYSTKIYYNHHQGNYPNVDRIIPIEFNYEIEIDRVNDLYNFIKPMKENHINFHLKENENKVIFEAKLSTGIATLELPVRVNKFENKDFKMMFGAKYFREAIEQLDKENFKMSIVGNVRPFILEKQINNKEIALVLPIRSIK
jgi:DNA polymerase III subunit beta